MSAPCCRRGAAASALPGGLLLVLPKCPLRLVAWFAAVGMPARRRGARAWNSIVIIWVGALTVAWRRRLWGGQSWPQAEL